jgi:hypothetical protein
MSKDFDNMNKEDFEKLPKKEFAGALEYFGIDDTGDKECNLTLIIIAQRKKGQTNAEIMPVRGEL